MPHKLPLRPVERSSLEGEVYRSLREAILSRRLEGKLVQDEIAASLGVSRIPVRTALKRLESEHLATIDERGGYWVRTIDLADLQEVYALRALLEPYATRVAVPRITPEGIALLGRLLESMRGSGDDLDSYVELNMEFHRAIYQAAGMVRLQRMIESNWAGIPPSTPKTVPGQLEHSLGGHAAILSAIQAGDADLAAGLVEKHIQSAGERLISTVTKQQPAE